MLLDELVDRTSGRTQTYVERWAVHLPFADPDCPRVSDALVGAAPDVRRGGTMVVVERAAVLHPGRVALGRRPGLEVLVNMTGHPEAVLAREVLRMCYSALALVTDMDAGAETGSGVGQEEVFALFKANLERLTGLLLIAAIAALPSPEGCTCATWADGIDLTYEIP